MRRAPPTRVVAIAADEVHRAVLREHLASLAPPVDVLAVLAAIPASAAQTRSLGPDVVLLAPETTADGCLAIGASLADLRRVVLLPGAGGPGDTVAREARRLGGYHVTEALPAPSDPLAARRRRALATLLASLRVPVRPMPLDRSPDAPSAAVRVVLIAASTGGPAALRQLFCALPIGVLPPVLVVQHLARGFTPGLATWLRDTTGHDVRVAEAGTVAARGVVYLAPNDRHLLLDADLTLALSDGPAVTFMRPAADLLFASAEGLAPAVRVLVLTGMGRDGADGAARLRRAGARVGVQLPASCTVSGMPRAVIALGGADAVLDVRGLAVWLAAECLGRPS